MKEQNSCDKPLDFSGLTTSISESLTEIQWLVIKSRFIEQATLDAIGATLGVASSRVRHIQNKALEKLINLLDEEIEFFSIKLKKLLFDAGGKLTMTECLREFPEITETDFIILFVACQKNKDGMFRRSNDLISVNNI